MNLALIKTYFSLSSLVAPKKTAEKSFELFQTVRKKSIRRREEAFFEQATKFKVEFGSEAIDCFELGNPDGKLVILVHGWDSNAGSMSRIADKFVENSYRVIAFNLPGHATYRATSTNLLICKQAFQQVLRHLDPQDPFSVVSHSFGSAVVANGLAYSDYSIDKLVFLTNPNKVEDIFKEFKKIIGLNKLAYKHLIKHTSALLGGPISNLDVAANVGTISYSNLLMIHDKHDAVLPFSNSFQINSVVQKSQLITFEKIGHYKMLWNEEVIGRTFAFVEGKEVL